MLNFLKKHFLESNKLLFTLFFISMGIAAIFISLNWNKITQSYWGLIYLILALGIIWEGYKIFVLKKK